MPANPPPEYRVQPNDPEILKEVATGLCRHFSVEADALDREEAIGVLIEVLQVSDDGYEMARDLDRTYGWEVHEEDVEALSAAYAQLRNIAHKKTLAKIQELKVVPRFSVGDTVTWTTTWRAIKIGKIVSVLPREMTYHVPIIENNKKIEYFVRDEDLTKVPE